MSGYGGEGGGVAIQNFSFTKNFKREFSKLTPDLQKRTESALAKLIQTPRPAGIRFEKLQQPPNTYTIHVTGNYKVSMSIESGTAILRRVANHKTIDRCP